MNGISLFSGVGGIDLGLERAGVTIAGHAEVDAACREVLAHRWPGIPTWTDVRDVARSGEPVPDDIGIVFGGFPCQDLSVAGKRRGLAGERSGLFFEASRVADTVLGDGGWVLIENVPGLLSSNGGRDFGIVLQTLAQLGFHDLAYRVLDSRYFGVPQRRRRVFILARRARGDRARAVLLEPESGGGDFAASGEAGQGTADAAEGGSGGSGGSVGAFMAGQGSAAGGIGYEIGVSPTLKGAASGTNRAPTVVGPREWPAKVAPTLNKAFADKQGLEDQHALSGAGCFVPAEVGTLTRKGPGTYGAPEIDANQIIAPPLTAANDPSRSPQSAEVTAQIESAHGAGAGVRRLTPVECERLQGFPDGWTITDGSDWRDHPRPDGPRYAQMGNAVTVTVAEWIGKRLMKVEHEGLENR